MISAVGLSLLVYIVLATAGYLTFGSAVKGDILETYPSDSVVVAVARIGISFIVTMCYPLQARAPPRAPRAALCARRCPVRAPPPADTPCGCVTPARETHRTSRDAPPVLLCRPFGAPLASGVRDSAPRCAASWTFCAAAPRRRRTPHEVVSPPSSSPRATLTASDA
eukprot:5453888-Prymnesium_polylepis.1